jgi:hypothetical protein
MIYVRLGGWHHDMEQCAVSIIHPVQLFLYQLSVTKKEVIPPLAMYRHVNLKLLTTSTREKQLPKCSYFSLFNVSVFLT